MTPFMLAEFVYNRKDAENIKKEVFEKWTASPLSCVLKHNARLCLFLLGPTPERVLTIFIVYKLLEPYAMKVARTVVA